MACGASWTRSRADVARHAELEAFTGWLLGRGTQTGTALGSARSFRRRAAWCWRVAPRLPVTGEIYDEVQVDGIYLSSKWCCLIAVTRGKVIAWQWCDQEKRASWNALLQRVPAPRVVVCDGQGGLLAALRKCWAHTLVQRCLVHVQRNLRGYLTSKPRTDAGKALWALGKSLTKITTTEQADTWMAQLNGWHTLYGELTKQRTYRDTLPAGANEIPSWIKPNQRWWYTHAKLRSAYRLLAKLVQNQTLFSYLRPEYAGLSITATTNQIEGGINAGLRDLLRRHRGMPPNHQRRAIEWWLLAHSTARIAPASLIQPEHHQPPAKPQPVNEPLGPALYDTALSPEEGLWTRKG